MSTVNGTDVPVQVLHRLALGLEALDHLTEQPLSCVRVDEELAALGSTGGGHVRVDPLELPGGLRSFESTGTRHKLRHGPTVRRSFTTRIHDPRRQCVPRRLIVNVWPPTDDATIIPVRYRVLRPWLLPGTARVLPRMTTGIRGRVRIGSLAVRWPRVTARRLGTTEILGRAHGDDRGEFLLVLRRSGGGFWPPAAGTVSIELTISADPLALRPPTAEQLTARQLDPLTDLPQEPLPPVLTPLDEPLLRGEVDPSTYVQSTSRPVESLPVGRLLVRTLPYQFQSP